jgi:formylglycine-generating enzyme required for sulfatase activity
MAVLFVSHSSKDEAAGRALEDWLRRRGFSDLFVDYSSIAGGAKWAQALRDSAGACRVVICLVTEHWLASDECFGEFKAAWYMGKRIIPLLAPEAGNALSEHRLKNLLVEDQGLNIAACVTAEGRLDLTRDPEVERRLESGLRAAGALARVGLDPEAFAIERKLRPMPFPGLASFGDADADAALFYGRSREIAEVLEELRKVRAERDLRPFVILGASGAGKSSLLKAGIIPRLRREAPAWLPLHAFRPGADPLLNFAEALAHSLADFGKIEAHGLIRDLLLETWSKAERDDKGLTAAGCAALTAVLEAQGHKLRDAACRDAATILICVDQAEEMARAEGDSGEALADYLRVALAAPMSSWQLAFTIRTDSFPELQNHRRFQDLKARGYDLRAIPAFRFDSVIEEPAKRYGVTVDHSLVDALMEEAPKADALPLLAFALQRLWRQYAASGALTKDNYDKVGGLRGLIEDAAERALRGLMPEDDVPLPAIAPAKRQLDVAAATFVPALAQINDQGATIRRIAAWNSFDDEQRQLLIRFDIWRLVVRKGTETEGGTVEVAHEALFREWARLKGWLEPERARLEALRSLQVDAQTWDRNGRDAVFLNHRDKRLAEADALASIANYRLRLGKVELDYLAACEGAERLSRQRTRRVQTLAYAGVVVIILGFFGWTNQSRLVGQWHRWTVERPYMFKEVLPHVLAAQAEHALKPGQSFKECAKDCPEMIVIPAGTLMMGSPDTEPGRQSNESPQHKVTFPKPFAVSKFDVTYEEWDACAANGDCPRNSDNTWGRGRRPAILVSWDDAKLYVEWLSRVTGKTYRLLSEAEWEYAARAGTRTAYYWGDEIGTGNAHCGGCGGSQEDALRTVPVGSYKPNQFGLYDMAGNVRQWVEDCVHTSYEGAPADGSAWMKNGDCGSHVVRGGSWRTDPRILRAANRNSFSTDVRIANLGVRVARSLAP